MNCSHAPMRHVRCLNLVRAKPTSSSINPAPMKPPSTGRITPVTKLDCVPSSKNKTRCRDLIRHGVAPHWRVMQDGASHRGRVHRLYQRRVDRAGRDRIHPDTIAREIHRHHLGQDHDRALGGAVGGAPLEAAQAGNRSDVDYGAGALVLHDACGGAPDNERPGHVDIESRCGIATLACRARGCRRRCPPN